MKRTPVWLAVTLGVIMVATLPVAVYRGATSVAMWALVSVALALSILAGRRQDRRLWRIALALFLVFILLTWTACSPYTNGSGPLVPPQVVGMEWTTHATDGYDCALGVAADGSVFVAKAFGLPTEVVVGWLAWGIGHDGPPGYSVADCWNTAQWNWPNGFNLYVQCFGQPVLRSTWTDYGAAAAWVQVPWCFCNQGCQRMASIIAPFWTQNSLWCMFNILDPRCSPGGPRAAAAVSETTTGDPPPDGTVIDPVNGTGDFVAPAWDVHAFIDVNTGQVIPN